jgi:rhodanese-related sulfurtransferase
MAQGDHESTEDGALKPGVATPAELQDFLAAAGNQLFIADVRNTDFDVEPGDAKSVALSPLPTSETRPLAKLLTFDRSSNTMPLPDVGKDVYIITHCGAGGRGQMAKEYLEQQGFKNVINGGGPKYQELWNLYGDK